MKVLHVVQTFALFLIVKSAMINALHVTYHGQSKLNVGRDVASWESEIPAQVTMD